MNICQRNHAFHWKTSDFTSSTEDISFSFTLDEYVNKTKECIDALYLAMSKNETHAYNEYDLDLNSLELCKKQMDIKAVMPSNFVTRNEFVQEEKFHFYPISCISSYVVINQWIQSISIIIITCYECTAWRIYLYYCIISTKGLK